MTQLLQCAFIFCHLLGIFRVMFLPAVTDLYTSLTHLLTPCKCTVNHLSNMFNTAVTTADLPPPPPPPQEARANKPWNILWKDVCMFLTSEMITHDVDNSQLQTDFIPFYVLYYFCLCIMSFFSFFRLNGLCSKERKSIYFIPKVLMILCSKNNGTL